MNKIKYNKKRSNKNIKSIPPYNKKGFFKTNNEFLLNKRYELFTNKKVIDAMGKIDKEIRLITQGKSKQKNKLELESQVQKLSNQQIDFLLSNKDKLKKFYDSISFDKKNKNRTFWSSYGQTIFYPYSVVGNKYEKWFDEYYDWISEFQSLYNWDKTKNQFQNSLRLMDNEEYNRILESNENQNPSWSDKADIWKRFSINPLYDGKDYNLVSSVFNFDDVLFKSKYNEQDLGDRLTQDSEVGENEFFIRKNAKCKFQPIKILTKTFKDVQREYEFIPDGFRLDVKKTMNGFESITSLLNSFSDEEILKYGILYEDTNGENKYFAKDPMGVTIQNIKEYSSWIKYFKIKLEFYDKQLQFVNPFTTFYKNVELKRNTQKELIENYEDDLNQYRDNLKDCKNGDYELVWRENKSNTDYKFPTIEFKNGGRIRQTLVNEYYGKDVIGKRIV